MGSKLYPQLHTFLFIPLLQICFFCWQIIVLSHTAIFRLICFTFRAQCWNGGWVAFPPHRGAIKKSFSPNRDVIQKKKVYEPKFQIKNSICLPGNRRRCHLLQGGTTLEENVWCGHKTNIGKLVVIEWRGLGQIQFIDINDIVYTVSSSRTSKESLRSSR